MTRHPQVRQCEQGRQLCSVLGQAAVADLDEAELPLDDPKRMFDLGPDAGLDPLDLVDDGVACAAAVERAALAGAHRHVPVRRPGIVALGNALIADITEGIGLVAMQERVALCDIVDVGRRADDGVDQARFAPFG